MIKIIDNQKLELQYKKGFGAWTYHIGTIDDFEIKNINLAPRKNEDKIISINHEIRDAIGKSGGDMVMVTLYLHD